MKRKPIRYTLLYKTEGVPPNSKVLIYNTKGQKYGLNEIASFIWVLLDGEQTIEELINIIVKEYNTTKIQAQKDILNLLRRFEQDELVIIDYNPLYPYLHKKKE
jgi:methyltransferase-like protein